jgi:hypothetical protein
MIAHAGIIALRAYGSQLACDFPRPADRIAGPRGLGPFARFGL